MITDIGSYLRWFDSIRRRTERDIAALPPNAAAWCPPAVHGGNRLEYRRYRGPHRQLAPVFRERLPR